MFLDRLRNLNAEKNDLDELVELSVMADAATKKFEDMKLPVPDYLKEGSVVLKNEIEARRKDALQRALKLAKQKRETLRTREEQRATTDEEIAKLEAALAGE